MDRQTVMRAMLKCGTEQKQQNNTTNCPNCCQLNNSEMFSNYVYKNTKLESNGPYGSAMRTKVCAKLLLLDVQSVQQAFLPPQTEGNESLLFSNEWGMECKRFYMVKWT